MEQALQERLDRIGQRMDTFEEKPGRMDELATKASVDELARQVQEELRSTRIGAVHDMQVILENTIMKQRKLLAEGQQTLLETLAPKSGVEDLEEDAATLKQAVRMMSQDIAELKKPRVYLKTANAPGQQSFLRCAASFFLEIRQYSCGKSVLHSTKIPRCRSHFQFSDTP